MKDSQATWDKYFMNMATLVSSKSKDRSIKTGTVIVGHNNTLLSTGYNGFIRGVDDNNDELHYRPEKYVWTEHDARNAIYNAAANGIKTLGASAYLTSNPCIECSRALVQAGISFVMVPSFDNDPFAERERMDVWSDSLHKGREIMEAVDIVVEEYVVR